MHIQADRVLIPAHIPAVRHLTITITAPGRRPDAAARAPVDVALVLDRSGSMGGHKIAMARRAVEHAVKLLTSRDHLAVVVYDDRVDTLLERSPASSEARQRALSQLARVDARGSTDLAEGWFTGVRALAPGTSPTRRVLLLSDGLANRGLVDPGELAAAAARFRAEGVTTSTFGVGADFDEHLLSRIAIEGGGHFYYLESPVQIPDVLTSALGETLEIVARDVVVDLTAGSGVEATLLNGLPFEASRGRLRVRLGDLVSEQEITIAVAVSCVPQLLESTVFLDCRVTDRDGALFSEPMRVTWRTASLEENDRQPVNQQVLVACAEILADCARHSALAANRRGDFLEAQRVIRTVVEHLLGLAPGNRRILELVDELRHDELTLGEAMGPAARKALHYASYLRTHSRDSQGRAKRAGRTDGNRT